MVELIEQALSEKQTEVDEANRKLAEMDGQYKAVTAERELLKAEIPKLTDRAVKAEETAKEKQAAVTAKTEEVKRVADKLFEADRQNGSLWSNVQRGLLIMGAAYLFFTFGLPGIIKHLNSSNPIKGWLRDATGYLTSPLLYHDAKKKLKEKET